MRCERVRALLSDYLDGELSPAGTAGVRGHLRACPTCEREHEALRRTVQLIAAHGRQTVPVDCRNQVLARLNSGSGRMSEGATGRRALFGPPFAPSLRTVWGRATAAAAVACACFAGGSLLDRSGGEPAPSSPAPQVAQSNPREEYIQFHGPDQFGQAMGRADGIILASDLVEAP